MTAGIFFLEFALDASPIFVSGQTVNKTFELSNYSSTMTGIDSAVEIELTRVLRAQRSSVSLLLTDRQSGGDMAGD